MLAALAFLNEEKTAVEIAGHWQRLLDVTGHSEPPDFHRYYPTHLLQKCAEEAFRGFTGMGCKPWAGTERDSVRHVLNEAWQRFWTDPKAYVAWEKETSEALLAATPRR